MRRAAVRLSAWMLLAAGVLGDPRAAGAFCRSTTCTSDCAVNEKGCKTKGEPLVWKTSCVGMSLQKDASRHIPLEDARPPILSALASWSKPQCEGGEGTISFAEIKPSACHRIEFDEGGPNANVVMFQDDKWIYLAEDNQLAKTTVTYDPETGEILDTDVELNHALNELTVSDTNVVYDVESIMVHEAGHVLGLDHTDDFEAVMHAEHSVRFETGRALAADDLAAVCAAYPPDRSAKCDTAPHGGFTAECATSPEGDDGCAVAPRPRAPASLAGAALAAALLALARRRSQRPILKAPTRSPISRNSRM